MHYSLLVALEDYSEDALNEALAPYQEYDDDLESPYVEFFDETEECLQRYQKEDFEALKDADGKIIEMHKGTDFRDPTNEELDIINGKKNEQGIRLSTYSKDWGDGLGIRPKVEYIPDNFQVVRIPYKEYYKSFEEYVAAHYDSEDMQDGRPGHWDNPNGKWDYWSIGGRWSDYLYTFSGKYVDVAKKKQVDFLSMIEKKYQEKIAQYESVHKALNGKKFFTWEQALQGIISRESYSKQPALIAAREALNKEVMLHQCDIFMQEREDFIRQIKFQAYSTYAILYQGCWCERKQYLKLWRTDPENEKKWQEKYNEILDAIPEDYDIVIVDYHR